MNLFFLTPFFRGPLLKNKTSRNRLLLCVKMLITVLLINQWITIGKKYFADHDAIRMVEREAASQRHIVADLIGVLLLQLDSELVLKTKGERERKALAKTWPQIKEEEEQKKRPHQQGSTPAQMDAEEGFRMMGQLFNFIQEYAQREKELPNNYRTRTSVAAANASPRIGGTPRDSVSPKRTRYGKFLDMHCEVVENTWLTFLFRYKLHQFD